MDLSNDLYSLTHPVAWDKETSKHIDVRLTPKQWPAPSSSGVPYYAISFDSPFESEVQITLQDLYSRGWDMRIQQNRVGCSIYVKMKHPKFKLAIKFKLPHDMVNMHHTNVYEFLIAWSALKDIGYQGVFNDGEVEQAIVTPTTVPVAAKLTVDVDDLGDDELLFILNERSAARLGPLDTSGNETMSAKVIAFRQRKAA